MPKFYKCNADRTFIIEKNNDPYSGHWLKNAHKQKRLRPVYPLNRLQGYQYQISP